MLLGFRLRNSYAHSSALPLPPASPTELHNITLYIEEEYGFPEVNAKKKHVKPDPIIFPLDWTKLLEDVMGAKMSIVLINEDMDMFIHLTSKDIIATDDDNKNGRLNISVTLPRIGEWAIGAHFHYKSGGRVIKKNLH